MEREPLSSNSHVTVSAISSGLLVDTNLDTSTPDTYRSPPTPLPFDVGLASSQVVPQDIGSQGTKADQTIEETNDKFETSDCKSKTHSEHNSPKVIEDEVSKPIISTTDEEDVCPICLEGDLVIFINNLHSMLQLSRYVAYETSNMFGLQE